MLCISWFKPATTITYNCASLRRFTSALHFGASLRLTFRLHFGIMDRAHSLVASRSRAEAPPAEALRTDEEEDWEQQYEATETVDKPSAKASASCARYNATGRKPKASKGATNCFVCPEKSCLTLDFVGPIIR
jgi:hypothetical protein